MVLAAAALSFPRVEPSRTEQLAAALGLKALQLDHLRRGAANTAPVALVAAHCQLEQRLQARSLLAAQAGSLGIIGGEGRQLRLKCEAIRHVQRSVVVDGQTVAETLLHATWPDPVGAPHAGDEVCSSCVGTGRVVTQTSPIRAQRQAGGFAEASTSGFCDVPSVAWLTGLRIDSGHHAPSSSRFRLHEPFSWPAGQGDLVAEEFTITEPTC